MEHITLLIYLASISNSFGFAMSMIGLLSSFAWVLMKIIFLTNGLDSENKEFLRTMPFIGLTAIIASTLAIATPNQNTIYLMAGAEIGKEVVQSETAKKVKAVLDKKLDEILADGVKSENSSKNRQQSRDDCKHI